MHYELTANGPYSYAVLINGKDVGTVERDIRTSRRNARWYSSNSAGHRCEHLTRQSAIDTLLELASR
jgi:hypothetical protein